MRLLRRIIIIIAVSVFALSVLTYLFMQQKSFGKLPSGKRLERVRQSPQYRDGSFQNIEKTAMLAEGVSYFRMLREFFSEGIDRIPAEPLHTVKTDLRALPVNEPTLVWFGHSSYLLTLGGKRILIDPVFSKRASPVQYAGVSSFAYTHAYTADDFPDIDIVIITHDHYDHLDYGSIQKLKDRVTLFCTALGVGEHLEYWGVAPGRIREFDWWEGAEVVPGFTLTATPARHFSGRGFTRNQTLWTSFVLQAAGYKLFLGGDSGYDGSFKIIGDKFGPFDLALVECGQYNEKWPDIHMQPENTVQAGVDLKAKVLMPVHWGKFKLALHPWREPIIRSTRRAQELGVSVTTPKIGEVVKLNSSLPAEHWWEKEK